MSYSNVGTGLAVDVAQINKDYVEDSEYRAKYISAIL